MSIDILRTHILVLILPIVTIVLIQFAFVNLMHEEIKNANFLVVENARNNFDNIIENVEKISKQLNMNDNITMMYYDSVHNDSYNLKDSIHALSYISKTTDDVEDIFIYNNRSDVVVTTIGRGDCSSFVESYYRDTDMDLARWKEEMQQLKTETVRIVYTNDKKEVAYVEFLYPMTGNSIEYYNGKQNAFPAILTVRINYKKLLLSEDIQKSNSHTMLFSVDAEGNIVGDRNSMSENSEYILKKCGDKSEITFTHKGKIYVCKRSKKTDWIYVTYMPARIYNSKSYIVIIITFLSMGLIFLLGIRLIKNFIRTTYGNLVKMSEAIGGQIDKTNKKSIENLMEYFNEILEERNVLLTNIERRKKDESYIALLKLLQGINIEKNNSYLVQLEKNMASDYMAVVSCKIKDSRNLYKGTADEILSGEEKEKDSFKIVENVITELLEKNYAVATAYVDSKLVFLVGNRFDKRQKINVELPLKLEEYASFLEEKFFIKVIFSVGKSVTSYNDVSKSYLDSKEIIRYSLILENSKVIVSDKYSSRNDKYQITQEQRQRLLTNLSCGNLNEVIDAIDEMYICNIKSRYLSYEMIKCFLVDLLEIFSEVSNDTDDLTKKILVCSEIEETRKIFHNYAEKICSEKSQKEDITMKNLVEKIEKYIDKYYTDNNINVFGIANEFGFSREYISRIFKKYTNTTVLEAIHSRRMILAKELLEEGMSVNDVAKQTGYTNSNVFIRRFKQYMNVTPKEYAMRYENIDSEDN